MNRQKKRLFGIFWTGLLLTVLLRPLQANTPNIILLVADDIGTGWLPFHADRLKRSDLEPEILASYEQKRGHLGKVDAVTHIEAARTCMPFLERLARQGISFDKCFATASLCAPSRAGLLTGTCQQEWGAYWNKDVDDHGIPADRVVLAEPLQQAGYATAMIGKWHVAKKDPAMIEKIWTEELGESLPLPKGYKGRWKDVSRLIPGSGYQTSAIPGQHPLDRGFDYYYGFNSHDSKYFGAKELWENRERIPERPKDEFLTELLSGKADSFVRTAIDNNKPFFLYYAPLTLHGGIVPPPKKYSSRFHTGNRFSDEYAGHMLALDEGIRQLFATLESKNQLDNTLFVFATDNGCTLYEVPPYNAPNRGGKGTGWFGGLNVPLVVWGKGVDRNGVSQEIVSLSDIMPTVLEFAGVEVPQGISGRSLLPYLEGRVDHSPRDYLSSASIQSSRWSYFYEGHGENNTQDGAKAPLYGWHFDGRHLLMRVTPMMSGLYKSLPQGMPAQVMLFDVSADRQQRKNLAFGNWEKVTAMDEALRAWLRTLQPPLTSQKQDFEILLKKVERPTGN